MLLNHNSPASIRAFLEARGIAPRKRWGQNFLINQGAREKIVRLLEIEPGHNVWEIGPGLGAMSELMLYPGVKLTLFELDPAYCEWLRESLGSRLAKLVEGDVMRTWKEEWRINIPDRVLGNLPYNAASAIIAAFMENQSLAQRCIFTVQDEMGQRMLAAPASSAYSSFSILCQTHGRVIDGGRLLPGSFYPAPRVQSRIIILEPAEPFGRIHGLEIFRRLIRVMFTSRRKTLANNLKFAGNVKGLPSADNIIPAFEKSGINLSRRPETVTPGEWVDVANNIFYQGMR
ncbi:MAG: ribosomal RNA small subunit methyltransferase A [Spirochaeta sp. LUC14_002_19_P3]|nr:MAG: ribosomal RNA small subunit methyltransferase A [Spirochaeta sp. LUC14_002_19_P3]